MRTNLPRVLAVLAAACLVFQAPAAAATDTPLERERERAERRRDQVGDELDATRSDLAETRERQQDTLAGLRTIDAEHSRLEAELERLDTRLTQAEAEVAEAELALRRTEHEIERNTTELDETRRELEIERDQLRARARATFMRGGVSYPEVVLDIDVANELGASLQYLHSMMSGDQRQVQQITSLERRYDAAIERLDDLRVVQDAARARAARERNRVAELVAERRTVAAELQERADEHQRVLAALERDERRYAAATDELEAQSETIRARLAELAAQQRAAASQAAASSGSSSGGASRSSGSAPSTSSGRFQWPVNGVVTSGFGYRTHPVLGYRRLHAGVDFGAGTGTPIVAADAGTVVSAGWHGGYGNAVVIDHGGGVATLYGHQSRLAVGSGTRVSRGQIVGYVGSTGMSTGPHLHFEMRINGVPRDPMPRLRG